MILIYLGYVLGPMLVILGILIGNRIAWNRWGLKLNCGDIYLVSTMVSFVPMAVVSIIALLASVPVWLISSYWTLIPWTAISLYRGLTIPSQGEVVDAWRYENQCWDRTRRAFGNTIIPMPHPEWGFPFDYRPEPEKAVVVKQPKFHGFRRHQAGSTYTGSARFS